MCAEEAARVEPRSVEAHHDRAAALQETRPARRGRVGVHARARPRSRRSGDAAGAADLYINRLPPTNDHTETGLEFARRGSRRLKRVHAPHGARPDRALVARLALLEGQALNDLGRSREALMRLDAALAAVPDDLHARYERAVALFDLCRFAEAKRAFTEVLIKNPHDAWAHHHLGLTLERLGDVASAERELSRARIEAPAEFHAPVEVSAAEFRALVDDEAEKLPVELRADLGRVNFETADLPDLSDLTAEEPPLAPTILGLFRGAPHRRSARVGSARHRHLSQEPGARRRVPRRARPADPHHAAPRARPPARRGRRRAARARIGIVSAPLSAEQQHVTLEQQLRIERKKVEAVRELGRVLGATLDLDRLLVVLLEKVTDLLDAERATIYLVTDDGTHLESKIAQGGAIATIRLKTGEGIAGWVAQSAATVNIPDAYADPRFNQSVDQKSGFRTRSILCMPMPDHKGRTIGVVQVLNKRLGPFDADDEALLATVAAHAGIAIENSKLYFNVLGKNVALLSTQDQLRQRIAELDLLFEIESEAVGGARSRRAVVAPVVARDPARQRRGGIDLLRERARASCSSAPRRATAPTRCSA